MSRIKNHILCVTLCLCAIVSLSPSKAFAQGPAGDTARRFMTDVTVPGREFKGVKIPNILVIPAFSYLPAYPETYGTTDSTRGAIIYNTADANIYAWSGSAWACKSCGSGGSTDTTWLSWRIDQKLDSVTTNEDSTILYYWANGNRTHIVDIATAAAGGDTTVFEIVLDSTGQQNNRILFAKNKKIASDPNMLIDDVNHKMVINHLNIGVGGPSTKLFVKGNAIITDQLAVQGNLQNPYAVTNTVYDSTWKPIVTDNLGNERRMGYWPGGSGMVYPSAGIPVSTGSAWGSSITDNSANWNTAFGWGNHASAGYVPQTRTINGFDLSANRTLTTTNIGEGTNLYYTDARARAAISLTTTGTSGAATYNSGTGVLNIPQYSGGGGGVTRVGTLDSLTKVARGGQVVTDANGTPTLILQTADATYPGLLGTGSQTFAGDKTFNGTLGFGFTTNDVAYFKMRTVGAGNNSGIGWNGGNIWQFYNPSSASYSFNGGGDFNATSTTNQWASISSAQITHSTKIQAPLFSSGSTASGVHQYYRPAGSGANTGVGYVTGYCQFFQYSGYGFTWNGSGDLQTTVGTNEWLRLDATGLYTPSGKKMAVGTISPSSSTILDVASTSLASRPSPPMTGGQRDAISSPATGATIYNNDNRAISQYNGSNWINDVVVSSAGSLTLKYGNDYVFTGSTSTWTLPAITANVIGRTNGIKIKNRGSGAITLNTSTGSTLYTTAAASTITINAGAACELLPDGTYNLVLFNQ